VAVGSVAVVHEVLNPATEEVVARVPEASAAEAELAVRRAEQAAVVWGGLSPADRARLLRAFAALVDRDAEDLAQLEVAEAGHPIASARGEAATAPYAVFDNAGQDCCARSRMLVQRPVFDEFMERFEAAVGGVVVGDPADEKTEMGPLISAAQRERVRGFVPPDAPVAFRGSAPSGAGFWYAPTVLAGDPAAVTGLPAWRDEVFGPVACVVPFEDEADAIRLANATPYGLSGSIWTRDTGQAIRVARAVAAGNLSVNSHSSVRYSTPFGGFKQSGLGRELGPDAPLAFTEEKNVFIATD
jgi:acyl-CoA reductase-like NAD-dependent aldehyde dehydrogenase